MPITSILALGDGARQVDDLHAGDLRYEDLAALHLPDAADDEMDALFQREPKAGHALVGDGHLAGLALLQEDRHHRAAAADDVAVAHAGEVRDAAGGVGVGLHDQLLGSQLGGPIEIDRVDRLVGAQRQHPPHPLINGSINDVASTDDIGLNGLKRVVLAGGNLFERGRMHHDGDPGEGPLQAGSVAHVSNEVTQAEMIQSRGAHIVLLEFVTTENNYPLWMKFFEHYLDKFLAKRARSTSY